MLNILWKTLLTTTALAFIFAINGCVRLLRTQGRHAIIRTATLEQVGSNVVNCSALSRY